MHLSPEVHAIIRRTEDQNKCDTGAAGSNGVSTRNRGTGEGSEWRGVLAQLVAAAGGAWEGLRLVHVALVRQRLRTLLIPHLERLGAGVVGDGNRIELAAVVLAAVEEHSRGRSKQRLNQAANVAATSIHGRRISPVEYQTTVCSTLSIAHRSVIRAVGRQDPRSHIRQHVIREQALVTQHLRAVPTTSVDACHRVHHCIQIGHIRIVIGFTITCVVAIEEEATVNATDAMEGTCEAYQSTCK